MNVHSERRIVVKVGIGLDFVVMCCSSCGVTYALIEDMQRIRTSDGKTFYCPNRHGQHYGNSTEKQLAKAKQEAERLKKSLDFAERQENEGRERAKVAERSLSATRGQVTKLRKRLGAGVCPYCTRHFSALERHIHSKHPEQPLPAEVVTAS